MFLTAYLLNVNSSPSICNRKLKHAVMISLFARACRRQSAPIYLKCLLGNQNFSHLEGLRQAQPDNTISVLFTNQHPAITEEHIIPNNQFPPSDISELLIKAIFFPSGDQDGVLMEPCPPYK